MDELQFPTDVAALAKEFSGRVVGTSQESFSCLLSLEDAVKSETSHFLCYVSDKKYLSVLEKVRGGVILVSEDLLLKDHPATFVVVDNPQNVFSRIAKTFLPKQPWEGISEKAIIHPTAVLGEKVVIAPGVVVCKGAVIGNHSVLFPNVYVGPDVRIGEKCEFHPSVVLVANVEVGDRVRIFSGTVLGSEGFGFSPDSGGGHTAVPQIGRVVIESDVRIGAKCTIDRATIGETRVGRGTIIDDQVHIGHNCRIGKNCILCAQVGLAGSTILEDSVVLGGQVGLAGHMTVGKGARLGGQTGAGTNLEGGKTYLSSPAMPIDEALRAFRYTKKLSELFKRVKRIEDKLNASTPDSDR